MKHPRVIRSKFLFQVYKKNLSVMDKHESMANSSINKTAEVDIDEAFEIAGSFGRYQIMVTFLVCFTHAPILSQTLMLYFVANEPPWTCINNNSSVFCKNHFGEKIPQSSELFKEKCKLNRSEWIFTKDKTYSIVTEYELVCDNAWMGSLANSALFIGWGLTGPFAGYLIDLYGRRMTMIISILVSAGTIFGLSFVNKVWQFIMLRTILGVAVGSLNANSIAFEVVGRRHRALVGTFLTVAFLIMSYLLVTAAYFIQNWRKLILYFSFGAIVSVLLSFLIPESARWLYATGKINKSEEKFYQMAKFNKKRNEVIHLKILEYAGNSNTKRFSFTDLLFRHFSVSVLCIALCFIWTTQVLLFYGLTLESSNFGGSIYLNFALSFVVELLTPVTYLYCSNKFGRKRSYMGFSLVATLSAISIAVLYFVSRSNRVLEILRLVLGLIGKSAISNGFAVVHLWTFELFPTVVRSQGLTICQLAGRIGSAAAPFIATNLSAFSKSLPFIVFGVFTLVSLLLSCILPETNNMKTRESFEDFFKSIPEQTSSLLTDQVSDEESNDGTSDRLNNITFSDHANDNSPLLYSKEV